MSKHAKTIEQVLCLTDNEYAEYVAHLASGEGYWALDELDDELLKIVERRPNDVERICRINSTVIEKLPDEEMRVHLLAYNFSTRLIAAIYRGSVLDAKAIFTDGIGHCRKHELYEAGKSISQNIFGLWMLAAMPSDEALYFLMVVKEFYEELGKHADCVEVLCAAALHFADAAAFQSAYRAIHDAQQIASDQNSLRWQAVILETQGMVALIEGDLDCADGEFKKCFKICAHLGKTLSPQLRANAALVKMRREDYGGAKGLYEELLKNYLADGDEVHTRQIRINLLVCCRELSDSKETEILCAQIETELDQYDLQSRIEGKLVLAKTYVATRDLSRAGKHLREACFLIQERIDDYQRLHYRRGMREHYVGRIKRLLAEIDSSGDAENVLPMLLLCSSNAMLDWLAVLRWCDTVLKSETIPPETKAKVKNKMEELIRFGTPFLYGPREKYDDPFEFASPKAMEQMSEEVARAADYSRPWREFNDVTAEICQNFGNSSPFEDASIIKCVERIETRLAAGSTFLFSYVCETGCEFFFVYGGQYFRETIAIDAIKEFWESLHEYQKGGRACRKLFQKQLEKVEADIATILKTVVATLEKSAASALVLVPDMFTEGLPIFPSVLASGMIRLRMKEGKFEFLTCPALWEEQGDCQVGGASLFMSNSEEKLEFAESERAVVQKAFPTNCSLALDLNSADLDFSKPPISSAEHLHLATHSVPANAFSDPSFVSTSLDVKKDSVWLESVQRESHKLQFRLVVLDGCNTGTTSNWNYYRRFATNEKVGLSSVFLLNRRCAVIATQWNEPEIASFTFSSLFYRRLESQRHGVRAFALAMVDLYELDVEATIEVFRGILDEGIREKRCEAIAAAASQHPFRSAYCLGLFQCHSLLFN